MDELQDYEVNDILECLPFLDKPDWERTRLAVYTNVQINSKKKLEPTDIMTFPWENEELTGKRGASPLQSPKEKSISDSDISRLKARASALSKIIKK